MNTLDILNPEIIVKTENYGLDVWLKSDRHWYLKNLHWFHIDRHKQTLQFEPTVIDRYDDIQNDIYKVIAASSDFDTVFRCEIAIHQRFGNSLAVTRFQPYNLDITHPQANKGEAVKYIALYLKIPTTEVVTIKDSFNDSMFANSAIGIAMGNTDAEVQEKAAHVTASNQEDGFYKAIASY